MVASAGPGPPPGAGASIPEGGTSEPLVAPSYSAVSWISRTFFSYVDPLLDRAAKGPLEEDDVEWIPPESDKAENLSVKFEREYAKVKARYAPVDADPGPAGPSGTAAPGPGSKGQGPGQARRAQRRPWTTITGITLLRLYWGQMILESLWVLVEVAQRLGTPVALREFLRWLQAYDAGENPPEWRGWVMAGVLGLCGSTMIIIHHQLFWIGMRNGFLMRQQVVAAVHAKVLRLNSAAVSVLSTGHVVNLVSNDVRRFDDVAPFWVFLWAAPLELCMVLLMVSLELDFLSALAGVATSLAVIPLQSALVRYIGGLRRNTARCTDERVRLAGEVVEGDPPGH
ncbi:hypothetical protein HYH03_013329 [Edaphochlamys debaryana]|uniref:ABC transmembrane type-1 domain-containing protein n=1 Tax=Edaphochlamys debaryana TaxID=47281 RepID=A0A836BTE6_9CHLO|nr:hypothetical protein HYH03_013329 [Edaphochlamys debaryana]|eukprot:KAG2488022.1 hypothetical protein HYH03_013329 [Edaphochlamys debaryana]